MIEFSGTVSETCKKYILKREAKIGLICFTGLALMVSIPIIVLAILYDKNIWACMVIPVVMILVCLLPFFLKDYSFGKHLDNYIPIRVTIDNEGEMLSESKKFQDYRAVSQVKKVVDMGEWYVIYFYVGHRTFHYVCQKDLIVKGTIEEFERIFENVMIKRY